MDSTGDNGLFKEKKATFYHPVTFVKWLQTTRKSEGGIGQIDEQYAGWRMQDDAWKDRTINSAQNQTMAEYGCRIIACAQMISTMLEREVTPLMFLYAVMDKESIPQKPKNA